MLTIQWYVGGISELSVFFKGEVATFCIAFVKDIFRVFRVNIT